MKLLLSTVSTLALAFATGDALAQAGPGATVNNAVGVWGQDINTGQPCLIAPAGGSATCKLPTVGGSGGGAAATAMALAATPTLCPTGQAPTGILANGDATGCAAAGGGGPWVPSGGVSGLGIGAIGGTSSASGEYAISGGYFANAMGEDSLALGAYASTSNIQDIAIGRNIVLTQNYETAIGGSSAANASVGDVAIGAFSSTASVVNTSSAVIGSTTYSGFAGASATSTVSIGGGNYEGIGPTRTITNVAPGQITATSTDAVNGSELYAVVAASGGGGAASGPAGGDLGGAYPNPTVISVGDVTGGVLSIANGGTGNASGAAATATALAAAPALCPTGQAPTGILANGDATGCAAASGGGSANPYFVANSTGAAAPTATGSNAVAIGAGAIASNQLSVALGAGATASGGYALALGWGAWATVGSYAVALGKSSTTAAVVSTSSAVIGGATYTGFAGAVPYSEVSIGQAMTPRTLVNLAAGRVTATSTDAVNGSELYAAALPPAATTVAGLASLTPVKFQRVPVTDASSPAYMSPLTGGGTTACWAMWNGTAWVAD